jgi:hypothetical protein
MNWPSRSPDRFLIQLIGDGPANHELRTYRIELQGENARVFYVIVSATAKAVAKPSAEKKIEEWLGRNPLPGAETTVRIPDDHFSSF